MLAIIPARGGSKRLPGKNTRLLGGKPLIHHTLEAAVAAKSITRVLFNTDSPEIRDIALQVPGVESPFLRAAEFATDSARATDLHFHILDWLQKNEGYKPESFCILLPTSPLRLSSDIDDAIALFHSAGADVVTSVTRAKPLSWHLEIDRQTRQMTPLLDIDAQVAIRNHQELPDPPVFLNGSIYVIKVAPYRSSRSYFGPKTYGYEMPATRAVDIDDMSDFRLAEALLSLRA